MGGFVIAPFLISLGQPLVALSVFFVCALIADGLTQHFGWRSSNNILRLLTGLTTGAAVPAVALFEAVRVVWYISGAN
jgi:uncharacterized membrane protein